jgi:excisionase family DNA binding protein
MAGAAGTACTTPVVQGTARRSAPTAAPELLTLTKELARLLAEPRPPRLSVGLEEAAAALGVSKPFLDQHIRHELRVVRKGRKVLVSVRELERWLAENAALTLGGQP